MFNSITRLASRRSASLIASPTLRWTGLNRSTVYSQLRKSHDHAHENPEPAGYSVGRIDGKKDDGYAKFLFVFTIVFLSSVTYKIYHTQNDSNKAREEAVEYMAQNGEKFEYFLPG